MILEIAIVILVLHLFLGVILYNHVKDLYGRPGAVGFPIIGNLYYFYRTLFLNNLKNMSQYYIKLIGNDKNDVFFHWFSGQRAVVITNPHFLEKLVYNPNAVEKPSVMLGPIRVFIDGLFSNYLADDDWKDRRKSMNNSLKKRHLENSYHYVFTENAKYLADELYESRKNVDVKISSFNITMNSILTTHTAFHPERMVLPYRTLRIIDQVLKISSRSFVNALEGNVVMRIAKLLEPMIMKDSYQLMSDVKIATENEIKGLTRQKTHEENVDLPLSMSIVRRNNARNLPFSQTVKELNELTMAGAHTVTVVITNSIYFLAVLPEIQEKAWQEQLKIFGNDDRSATLDDVRKMEYLDRFLSEALRFSGPSILAKYTSADISIDGVFIPNGTIVLIPVRKFHMDPSFWENPEEFDPERFPQKDNLPKYAILTFGAGPKSCPGRLYALHEMKIVLSTIIRRLKLSSDKKFKDLHFDCYWLNEVKNFPPIEIEKRK